jgi:hypothetical protein
MANLLNSSILDICEAEIQKIGELLLVVFVA